MRPLFRALLACAVTLAITASAAPVGGVPNAADVGPHQVLIENDLAAGAQPLGAVALLSQLTQAEAAAKCSLLNEQLLAYPTSTNDCAALDSQLSYLAFSKMLGTPRLWIASASTSASGVCQAYDSSAKQVVTVACGTSLNALCSSSGILSKDTSPAADAKVQITVRAKDITVTGYRDARSYRFLGIPYAAPPIGQLRFADPAPYAGPKHVSGLKYGDACSQPPTGIGSLDGSNVSENCLFVSVQSNYLPGSSSVGKRKPVLVWVHGGGFYAGSSYLGQYDLTNFASRGDVVAVSVTYRLGALGQLATKTLLDGNYALKDQIAALQWVQRNIASFGGDPSRVTVMGQSAGAQSIIALQSSTAAKGLFSAAMVQSNPIDLPWFTRDLYANTITPKVAFAAGCARFTEAEMVDCLRKVPVAKLISNTTAQTAVNTVNAAIIASDYFKSSAIVASIEPFLPIVDKAAGIIDDQFVKLLRSETLPNAVPTLFITVKDEGAQFVANVVPTLGNTQLLTDAGAFVAYSPAQAAAMVASGQFKVNSSDPDATRSLISRSVTQTEWLCPQQYLLDTYGKQFPALWAGLIVKGHSVALTLDPPNKRVPELCNQLDFVCHVGEIVLAFGSLNYATKSVLPYRNQKEVLYSQFLHDTWSAFIRTHDPTPAADYLLARGRKYAHTYDIFYKQGFEIKPYTNRRDTAVLGYPEDLRTGVSPFEEQCAFFEDRRPGGFGGFTFDHV